MIIHYFKAFIIHYSLFVWLIIYYSLYKQATIH